MERRLPPLAQSYQDPAGNTLSVTSVPSGGLIQELQRSGPSSSATVTESWLYTYLTSGPNVNLLANVAWRRSVGLGGFAVIRRVGGASTKFTISSRENGAAQTTLTTSCPQKAVCISKRLLPGGTIFPEESHESRSHPIRN